MPRSPLAPAGSAVAVPDASADLSASPLAPRADEQVLRMQADLRLGVPVLLQDGDASVLVALVDALTETRLRAMTALGTAEVVLTRRRCDALGVRPRTPAEVLRLEVPAEARMVWLEAVTGLDDQRPETPFAGPLPVPAAASPAQTTAIELVRAACAVPAVLTLTLAADAAPAGLLGLPVDEVNEALAELPSQTRVSHAKLPMDACEAGRVHAFRTDGGGAEHFAIEIGTPDPSEPVTVRLHSACFTGDVLGSLKCDCGPQLRAAMSAMAGNGGGLLLYLDQEGRGIGLVNKLRAYALQDAGLDTVEANHWLGFEDDQRDFRIGAQLLRQLGVDRVRLMTNNPAKVERLTAHGIQVVERIPIAVGETAHNAHYLATKAARSGHLL